MVDRDTDSTDSAYAAYLKKAHDRIDAAELLHQNGFYIDAVSRAYYGMYNAAKAALGEKGDNVTTHKGLIQQFGKELVQPGLIEKDLGRAFSYVEEEREDADYEPLIDISAEEAADIIGRAQRFLTAVETFRSDPD